MPADRVAFGSGLVYVRYVLPSSSAVEAAVVAATIAVSRRGDFLNERTGWGTHRML